jgi:hypothetical protein
VDEDALAEVRSALVAHGVPEAKVEVLSPPSFGRKSRRCTFRIEIDPGTVIKARRLESADEASRLAAIRARIDPSFVGVLGCYGSVLLEPWVAGEVLTPSSAEASAAQLGTILGRLHAAELPQGAERTSSEEHRERAAGQLAQLAGAGAISRELAELLRAALVRRDPGHADAVVVHWDYCPENVIVDEAGAFHVIDNEWLLVDAPGVDIGRTYSRWPVGREAWDRFLAGYRASAPFDPGPVDFWLIVMASAGAALRSQQPGTDLTLPVARLRELAEAAG